MVVDTDVIYGALQEQGITVAKTDADHQACGVKVVAADRCKSKVGGASKVVDATGLWSGMSTPMLP